MATPGCCPTLGVLLGAVIRSPSKGELCLDRLR